MIRMKVNEKQTSTCDECGREWKNTREMLDILLCGKRMSLCKQCQEDLFHKLLSMEVKYNAKVKSNLDISRRNNEHKIMYGEIPNRLCEVKDE